MNVKELILDGGELLNGTCRKLKINHAPDETCLVINSAKDGIVAVLDRNQTYLLKLWLEEYLK